MEFVEVGRELRSFLEGLNAPVAIVGALALGAYGVARATRDLDFVTVKTAQKALVSFLESLGYETLHLSSGYSNHLHADEDRGRVDVIYVDAPTAERLFASARELEVLTGLSILVPKPEHLIAMKARAIKNDASRRLQDMADVQSLMRSTELDRDEARGYFASLGLGHLFEEIEEGL
jgi:hypothetical protein